MNIIRNLGGYFIDTDGIRHQLPIVLNPSDSVTEQVIRKVFDIGRGVVVMSCKQIPDIGPEKLELYVDNGNLLLMLGVNELDGDYCVRTITNESMPNELIIVMGENYPAKAVTQDIRLAFAAFNEFARFGDVFSMR